MERKTFFYAQVRKKFFPSGLTQGQVDTIEAILNYWYTLNVGATSWLAYILATAYHETGGDMLPIEEVGKGQNHAYGDPDPETGVAYYGRGLVQLTHRRNYRLFADRLGLDLEHQPELALSLFPSVRILVDGMVHGLFTGKSLADYFPVGVESDWVGARRIVNGTDRARLVANYALIFYAALKAAEEAPMEDESVERVATTTGETLSMPSHPTPPPSSAVSTPAPPSVALSLPVSWWLRLLTSKIAWTQVVGFAANIGIIFGVDLPPEQQTRVVQIIMLVQSIATLILRVFFNHQLPRQQP